MPSLPHNPASWESVRTYLGEVLPEAHFSEARVENEDTPLLLLRTDHLLAAFAFAHGDSEASYAKLYTSFKKCYADQRGEWDALQLAFVFCIAPDATQLDQFSSKVETDVYFCRKFVLQLKSDLPQSLAQLPFIPLADVRGQSIRPPSAEVFMQQRNIHPTLAKRLVEQGRSAERIVQDCLAEEFGEPAPLTTTPIASTLRSIDRKFPIRIEELHITNFRAYRKPFSFKLGTAVTILYGPNGFGKTSFFDAIDFAATGGIGRIEAYHKIDLERTARHLDSGAEESKVVLTYKRNDETHKLTRRVADPKFAELDDVRKDRKAILAALTGGTYSSTDRVEILVKLFRASYLFSQEQQELTTGFQDDCTLRPDVVSRMLAFEDYTNSVNKVSGIRQHIQSTLDTTNTEVHSLTQSNTAAMGELERLGQATRASDNSETLVPQVRTFIEKLAAFGLDVPPGSIDSTALRGVRSNLESRAAETSSKAERLSALAAEVAKLPSVRTELERKSTLTRTKESVIEETEKKQNEAQLTLQEAEQELATLSAARIANKAREELLVWVRDIQPRHKQAVTLQVQLNSEIEASAITLSSLRGQIDQTQKDLLLQRNLGVQLSERLTQCKSKRADAESLRAKLPSWQVHKSQLGNILQLRPTRTKDLIALREAQPTLAQNLERAKSDEERLLRQIAEVDQKQSTLRALVSQLQGHVQTGTCPVCGVNHGSRDDLLARIRDHVEVDSASNARTELISVRSKLQMLNEELKVNQEKQKLAENQLAAWELEENNLRLQIEQIAALASRIEVLLDSPNALPSGQIEALSERLESEIVSLESQINSIETAIGSAQKMLEEASTNMNAQDLNLNEKRLSLERVRTEALGYSSDPRLNQVSLNIELNELEKLLAENNQAGADIEQRARKADSTAQAARKTIAGLLQERTSIKSELASLRVQVSDLQKTIAQVTTRLQESNLPTDANEDELLQAIAENARLQAQLLALRDTATSLELALDAATTAAALTTLRRAVRENQERIAQEIAKQDRLKPWLSYFERISSLLNEQRNSAIDSFISAYGPRTSVIQRRLRSVYGFDDIEIKSQDSAISVRMKRHGESLRPVDYLSQSQQQTLLLGLFLTASSSQTWSSFAPIFLDDPVTHFDDLNTYAFLDLILGLIQSEDSQRQFIISTCDKKLLDLALQKFHHLGPSAQFYHFTSIGEDGPAVEAIRPLNSRSLPPSA